MNIDRLKKLSQNGTRLEDFLQETLKFDSKKIAVFEYFDRDVELIEELVKWDSLNNEYIEIKGEELRVLTDSEANEAWEEYIDNYIEECVLSELSVFIQEYFDYGKFKRDLKLDGRGRSLASYDSIEHCFYNSKVDETIHIYRVN